MGTNGRSGERIGRYLDKSKRRYNHLYRMKKPSAKNSSKEEYLYRHPGGCGYFCA
jgi:hypothetical protein